LSGTKGHSGRKPTPTRLKLLHGNPGKRPLNENEPQPAPRLPSAPAHLSKEARKEWRRSGHLLLEMGLITDLDRAAFAAYCQSWSRWVEAEEALKTYGMMLRGPNNLPVRSPYLQVANQAMDQLRGLLSDFGMSPSSRSRVSASPMADEEDEFEALLRRSERTNRA